MPLLVEHGRNKTVDLTPEVAHSLRKQENEDVRREGDGRGGRCDTVDGIELTLFSSRQHRAEHNGGRSVFSPIQQIFPSASASGSGGVSAYQCKYGIKINEYTMGRLVALIKLVQYHRPGAASADAGPRDIPPSVDFGGFEEVLSM